MSWFSESGMRQSDSHIRISMSNKVTAEEDFSSMYIAGDFVLSSVSEPETPKRYFDNSILKHIRDAEVSLVNYEGVTSDAPEPGFTVGPLVEAHEDCPSLLSEAGFNGVTLANNHVVDLGAEGVMQTMNRCQEAGLETLGAGHNMQDAISPQRVEINDTTVSILNFSEYPVHSYARDDTRPTTADISHPTLIQTITEEVATTDVLVGIAHAGFMHVPVPPIQLQEQYRRLIDFGVDVIIGHHPHVPQGWERYDGKLIFYSLGNFLFDYDGRQTTHPEKWGLTLQLQFTDTGLDCVDIIPIEVVNRRVHYLGEERTREQYLDRLQRMTEIVNDDDVLPAMWMAIADMHFSDNKKKIVSDYDDFLSKMVLDSHRAAIETALIERATDIEVSEKISEEAMEMWKWSAVDPYETSSTKAFATIAQILYRGPIRYVSHRTGIHPHLIKIYYQLKDYFRRIE